MKLVLKNIGAIKEASIDLNGITVIAGENNTGKSTVGKVLFSIFNSLYKIQEQIVQERSGKIKEILDYVYFSFRNSYRRGFDTRELTKLFLDQSSQYIHDPDLLQQSIFEFYLQHDVNFKTYENNIEIENAVTKILDVLSVSNEEIFKLVLNRKLETEFCGQINNIYYPNEEGIIELSIKGSCVSVTVLENQITSLSGIFSLNTEAVYIDDPFVIDEAGSSVTLTPHRFHNHRTHLQKKLFMLESKSNIKDAIEEIITNKKLKMIFAKINTVCAGDLAETNHNDMGYRKRNSEAVLDIKNISTGLKTFVILKTLLLNGGLEEYGTVILDEPEIHLHPEWQLLFAELIVLLQREFEMHILLNTHSPYFLNAIEVYSAKYEITDKCKYYMAFNEDAQSHIVDVSANIEKIYEKLAYPLQELENERYRND